MRATVTACVFFLGALPAAASPMDWRVTGLLGGDPMTLTTTVDPSFVNGCRGDGAGEYETVAGSTALAWRGAVDPGSAYVEIDNPLGDCVPAPAALLRVFLAAFEPQPITGIGTFEIDLPDPGDGSVPVLSFDPLPTTGRYLHNSIRPLTFTNLEIQAVDPVAAPEPASVFLLGTGFLFLARRVRR
jgi:hypothetical protein